MKRPLHDRILGFPRFGNRPSRSQLAAEAGVSAMDRLSFNESPFGPSEAVRAAVRAEADRLGEYPTFADDDLREAIAVHFGRGLARAQVITGAGAYEVLELLARVSLDPGDECVLSSPTFEASPRIVGLEGGHVVDVPLLQPSFRLDLGGILGALTEKTRMVWVCNPNNPSGVGVTASEMATLVAELPEDVLLVADEAYHQFVRSEDAPDTLAYLAEGRPNVVIVHSLSKAYGLAGLRLGYALVPEWLGELVGRVHRAFHLSRIHLAAGMAAITDQDHVARSVAAILAERQALEDGLRTLGLRVLPSETNFVMAELPSAAEEVAQKLLGFGVQVRPLGDLGLDRYVRINVGPEAANRRLLAGLGELFKS